MKKLYIFDCFGVVVSEAPDIWAENHGIIEGEEIYEKWREIAAKDDLGEINVEELYQQNGELSGQKPEEVEREWMDNIIVNPDVVEVIKKLRKTGAKVVMLSNTGANIYDYLQKVGAEDIWDELFLSYQMKIKKPDPKAFLHVLEKMKVNPGDACFIDDREVNVRAAEKLGIEGVLYPSKKFEELV